LSTFEKIKILCIEKNGRRRAALARGLQKHGYAVFAASEGQTGLSLFREHHCEMVVCDPSLAENSGLNILDQIKGINPAIPIILLAPRWSSAIQPEALLRGAIFLISAPVKTDELASILGRAWEVYKARQPAQRDIQQRGLHIDPAIISNVEQQLHAIVDAAPTPTFVNRLKDGRIILANEHMAKMLGLSVESLIGRVTPDFYYLPEERDSLLDRLQRDRILHNCEVRLKRVDGTPFWALMSKVLSELNGEPVIIAGISDIDSQKSAEEALQRERNFVSAVLDTESALVVVLDTSGRIVRFNRACEQITGFTYEEVKGRLFWDVFLLREEMKRIRSVFEKLRAGNFPQSAENYWRTKNGDLKLISWSNTAILDADGKVEHIIATGIDITDKRKSEEDLRHAHVQLERRIEERTTEIAAINRQLLESERRLRRQNKVMASLARRQVPSEELGTSLKILTDAAAKVLEVERASVWLYDEGFSQIICLDLYERSVQKHSGGYALTATEYPGYFKALREQLAIAADDARSDPRTMEFAGSYLAPQGITSMLDAPIWVGGQMVGVLCHEHIGEVRHWTLDEQQFSASLADYASLAIEAHHRRRAEADLQDARAELERRVEERTAQLRATQTQLVQSEKMAALGMLVAGIAHEINTPVGAIHSTHDTLQRAVQKLKSELDRVCRPGEPRTAAIDSTMKIIEDATLIIASGSDRVTDIVHRLRSFARLDEAELKMADIQVGLEDTLALIQHELKHGINVKRNYGNVPPFACYPGQLNQVFLNILINARQAIGTRGEISITTHHEDARAFIEIADNGSGIPGEHLSRIFDPGFTTKGVGVGSGLGLSICYQIIRDHRGEINVTSEVGKGTTFTLILPMDLKTKPDA
jgi:PAS domain S-box-containing protein